MSPKQRRTAAVSRQTHATIQRIPQAQTGEIFKLPVEILFEIFSHLDDHRRFIHQTCRGLPIFATMQREHVERSTAIRKLTMTCWAMRDALLPVLWMDVEGCLVLHPRGQSYGLYDQCWYLLSNPNIAACVRTLSVDLAFRDAPKDLMKKFVDTLLRLPNLRTLELLGISHRSPVAAGLKRKCATFPNIREMIISPKYPDFVMSCPNLESLTFRHGFTSRSSVAINLCGAGLTRIAGIDFSRDRWVSYVVQHCPKLQEIGLFVESYWGGEKTLEHLRHLKNLAVIEVNFVEDDLFDTSQHVLEGREVWKRNSIDILKNSSYKDRKFLRWGINRLEDCDVMESGELEVFSETNQ